MGNCLKCCTEEIEIVGSGDDKNQERFFIRKISIFPTANVTSPKYSQCYYSGWSGGAIRCDGNNGECDGRGTDCAGGGSVGSRLDMASYGMKRKQSNVRVLVPYRGSESKRESIVDIAIRIDGPSDDKEQPGRKVSDNSGQYDGCDLEGVHNHD